MAVVYPTWYTAPLTFYIMYYVYLIKSKNSNWKYIGSTNDLRRRFAEHNHGYVRSTKPYKPFDLIFYEAFSAKKDAIRRERYFKTSKGKSTLRLMLRLSLS